jgi:hypothetical protein
LPGVGVSKPFLFLFCFIFCFLLCFFAGQFWRLVLFLSTPTVYPPHTHTFLWPLLRHCICITENIGLNERQSNFRYLKNRDWKK